MGVMTRLPVHYRARCAPDCDGCGMCSGGLFLCRSCGGAEASLPTECPGTKMSIFQCSMVHMGMIDYRGGRWVSDRGAAFDKGSS